MSSSKIVSAIKNIGRILYIPFLFVVIIFVSQDALIFPGAVFAFFSPPAEDELLPENVESFFVSTEDGVRLETWRMPAGKPRSDGLKVAIVFHGNGGSIRNFFPMQRWLAEIGFVSYAFDFRGFGKSSGWPSEKGIYADGEAIWQEILRREGVSAKEVLLFGISVGTGFAAELASRKQPAVLVQLSPYSSIPAVAREQRLIGFLTPLLRYSVPNAEYVSQLRTTCLIVAHGSEDVIILPHHSDTVTSQYVGSGGLHYIKQEQTGHNDLFWKVGEQLSGYIDTCALSNGSEASREPQPNDSQS